MYVSGGGHWQFAVSGARLQLNGSNQHQLHCQAWQGARWAPQLLLSTQPGPRPQWAENEGQPPLLSLLVIFLLLFVYVCVFKRVYSVTTQQLVCRCVRARDTYLFLCVCVHFYVCLCVCVCARVSCVQMCIPDHHTENALKNNFEIIIIIIIL